MGLTGLRPSCGASPTPQPRPTLSANHSSGIRSLLSGNGYVRRRRNIFIGAVPLHAWGSFAKTFRFPLNSSTPAVFHHTPPCSRLPPEPQRRRRCDRARKLRRRTCSAIHAPFSPIGSTSASPPPSLKMSSSPEVVELTDPEGSWSTSEMGEKELLQMVKDRVLPP